MGNMCAGPEEDRADNQLVAPSLKKLKDPMPQMVLESEAEVNEAKKQYDRNLRKKISSSGLSGMRSSQQLEEVNSRS